MIESAMIDGSYGLVIVQVMVIRLSKKMFNFHEVYAIKALAVSTVPDNAPFP